MARIINELEYARKRNEILAAAQRLVYTKGYEEMSIQDLLVELQMSKGAFYHYFNSKQSLLEALIDSMETGAEQLLTPIVEDPHLTAMEKLQRFFSDAAQWKANQKAYLYQLLTVWYDDGNAIVRQKVSLEATRRIAPLISKIVQQGIREGSMHTPFPGQAGEILLALLQNVGDAFGRQLLYPDPSEDLDKVREIVNAYNLAGERILGTQPGAIQFIEAEVLNEWLVISNPAK